MRYLIFAATAIGDTIFELSLAKALKQHDEEAYVALLVTGGNQSCDSVDCIVGCSEYADEVFATGRHTLPHLLKAVARLRKERFDYSFYCASNFKATDKPILFSKLIGCECISKRFKNSSALIKPDVAVEIDDDIHIVQQYEKLARALFPSARLDVGVLNGAKTFELLGNKPKHYDVLICVGANITLYKLDGKLIPVNIKKWNDSSWVRLANCLAESGFSVAVIGSPGDFGACQEDAFSDAVDNLIGKTTLLESLGLTAGSKLVVGADTGLMHCAAAYGTQTLSLFGGTDENVWKPYSPSNRVVSKPIACRPCYGKPHALHCKDRKCMNEISVDEVIRVIGSLS